MASVYFDQSVRPPQFADWHENDRPAVARTMAFERISEAAG